MTVNSSNIRIFGSDDDALYWGPLGIVLPTDLLDLPVDYTDFGWLAPDSAVITPEVSVKKVKGHQGGADARSLVEASSRSFAWEALETIDLTFELQHGKGTKTTAAGVTTIVLPRGFRIATGVLVLDTYDVGTGDEPIHYRWVWSRAEIGERSEVQISNSTPSTYKFKATLIGQPILITNDPQLVEA